MLKLIWRLSLLVLAALAVVWLAERPGSIAIHWQGQDVELSVFVGVILLVSLFAVLFFVIWLFRRIWRAPAVLRGSRKARREKRAYEALSRGIIAAGAGDSAAAARHAAIAGETLKHEPLVKLLGAQAAQLRGDKAEVARVFEAMSQHHDTALLGLRGLHGQARDQGDWQAAHQHAEAALSRNQGLGWAQLAMLHSLTRKQDWQGAAKIVEKMAKSGALAKAEAAQKQAALLCAAAMASEEKDKAAALKLASEAHALDATLTPAALTMARIYTTQAQPKRALKALRETWLKAPQRDLASAAAAAVDDTPEDKFERVRDLVGKEPATAEGRFALAHAAVLANRFEAARDILLADAKSEPAAGICALLAQIYDALGNAETSKSWLSRGLSAQADPMWMSDGRPVAQWMPLSPVSGEVVPCEWRSPQHRATQHQLALQPPSLAAATKAEAPLVLAAPPLPDDPGVEQDS